jgi:membrane-bound lytic murein transglycosylase D
VEKEIICTPLTMKATNQLFSRMAAVLHRGRVLLSFLLVLLHSGNSAAQWRTDSLYDNVLHHFHADPLHFEFHPEEHPSDSLFALFVPSVDMELVEDRVSCLELDMPLVVNKTVCGFIQYFTVRKRNYTQTMLERKNYYFPIFEYYLRKYEMPDALKYLSIVESGLNYKARSKAGAVGLWQFMPGTGRDFRLGQSVHLDQRQNPWLATEAACKFLKSLHGTFHDWELALAAYNCGPGNVMKAMRRSGKRGFWEIYQHLPQETRSYVPQFHAVVYSMNYAREHNIFPDIDSVLMAVPLDTFQVNKTCDLRKLESLIGMPPRSLQQHNPDIKTNVFPGGMLFVPGSHSGILAASLDSFIDSARVVVMPKTEEEPNRESRQVYLKRGTGIRKLSEKRGWNYESFCRLNQLKGDKIRKSGKYLIPLPVNPDNLRVAAADSSPVREGQQFVANGGDSKQGSSGTISGKQLPKHSSPAMHQSDKNEGSSAVLNKIYHNVEKGEGLFAIARMYGLDVARLRELNPGIGNQLQQGQKLRIRANGGSDEKADSVVCMEGQNDTELVKVNESAPAPETVSEPSGGRHLYMVQKGDTLYSITRKFNRLTVKELIKINKLKNKQIKPGQQLIVG